MTNTSTETATDISTPEGLMKSFSIRMNSGDLDGLMALYEESAVFGPEPGTVLCGHEEIRGALAQLLSLSPTMTANPVQVLVADDVARVVNDWSLVGTAPDGSQVHKEGHSADVARRQPDGRWLVLVDKP